MNVDIIESCVEKCSGMVKTCVEKCSEMPKSCVEKCSGMAKPCVEKCSEVAKSCVEKCSEVKPLPSSIVFTPPSLPPFPGDRNPSREGLTNLIELLADSIPYYMMVDIICAYFLLF